MFRKKPPPTNPFLPSTKSALGALNAKFNFLQQRMHIFSSNHYALLSFCPQHLLGGETQLRGRVDLGEDDKLALEEDIAEDGEADSGVALDTAVALRAGDRSVVDVRAGDDKLGATDDGGERRQSGAAGVDVTTLGAGVGSAGDLLVVGSHDGGREEQKSSAL